MKTLLWIGIAFLMMGFGGGDEKMTPLQYIETYKRIAVVEMHRTGIPASITMAQGLLESANGNSRLARQGNSHFGIKCKKTWTGKTIYEDDDAPGECFRAYDSAYLSFVDHSEFLMGNVRYAFLFEYDRTDYKNWAQGLKKAGYATNPKYPELLITIIERHELHKLDHLKPEDLDIVPIVEIPKTEPIPEPKKIEEGQVVFNDIPATRVQAGDNIIALAKQNEMGAWEIRRYNDLPKEQELTPGEIIYLKPKKRKGTIPYHVVQPGETMWSISQMYGIKLKHLYRKNRLDRKDSEQPIPGETLFLQKKNPDQPVTSERPETPIMKVVLPENPITPGDTLAELPILTTEPTLTPEEVKDTLNLPRERTDKSENVIIHTVSAGETLFILSKKYEISVEQIMELNGLHDYSIKLGQMLIINKSAKEETTDTETTSFVHTVQAGETLYAIARKYNMGVEELKRINNLVNDNLTIGQKLKLNRSETDSPESSTNELPATHTVEKGDTLYSLSRKYQVSVSELKKLNQLENELISIRQVLKLR